MFRSANARSVARLVLHRRESGKPFLDPRPVHSKVRSPEPRTSKDCEAARTGRPVENPHARIVGETEYPGAKHISRPVFARTARQALNEWLRHDNLVNSPREFQRGDSIDGSRRIRRCSLGSHVPLIGSSRALGYRRIYVPPVLIARRCADVDEERDRQEPQTGSEEHHREPVAILRPEPRLSPPPQSLRHVSRPIPRCGRPFDRCRSCGPAGQPDTPYRRLIHPR
jgi:hypothetical protein